ncbi:hypothetical protein CTAYLR_003616 [Chrysophaeum taylorii]|uniref:Alginate lyase domain-containing protein n=1 Tax=Chrysophaeum taylorii TaxID=2483200 RepID=A0AAD7UC57_9STRA|nr:hypothetical protein CTAYLR_003616 [Chrysophaeum taylorii]
MTDTYGLHPSEWGDLITPKFAQLNQNLYVINNNGARNTALRHGIRRGWAWTLPFDGNCFFTLEKWSALVSELDAAALRNVAYIAVPLVRTTVATLRKRDNAPPGLAANPERGEPQLAFSSAARLRFDPTVPYGHRPKVSMLWKLGVPGVWDSWNHDAVFRAEKKCEYIGVKRKVKPPSVCRRSLPEVDDEAANATLSTDEAVVFRLPDVWTKSAVSGDDYSSRHQRRDARDLGVKIRLDSINRAIVSSSRDASVFVKPLFFNVFSMEAMRHGGKLRRPSSAAFDGAARAYEMMSNVTLFALAHFYSGDPRFSEKSVRLVRAWFLDPKTRMPPTKSFSRCSAPTNRGGASYMKELTYALDAVALVERTTAWTQRDAIGMQRWCAKYLDSLATSRDRTLKNSQSWWYVLQYAAVARCVDSNNATTRQLQEFVAAQVARFLTPTYVDVDGILLYEIGRTRSLQNHFVGSHALVLAWRLLQNLGDVTSADAVADVLRRTAAVIDVTLRSVPRNCDIDHQAAHITTVRRAKLLEDACEIGIDLARESATPLCQWAFDLDAEFGATLSMCWRRHARSTPPGHRDVSPPFPTAAIEEFEWPPLLPSDPDSQQHLFPFQNTMW